MTKRLIIFWLPCLRFLTSNIPSQKFSIDVSNTLLLTVLISLLSNTFMLVSMNASEEVAYLHACKAFAGLTTDALFSYVPPLVREKCSKGNRVKSSRY